MLCPSDEIRRFVLTEEKSHFGKTRKRRRACDSVEIPDLPLRAVCFCVRLLGCSCRSASCGVLSRFASALPLDIRFAACLAAIEHPPINNRTNNQQTYSEFAITKKTNEPQILIKPTSESKTHNLISISKAKNWAHIAQFLILLFNTLSNAWRRFHLQ